VQFLTANFIGPALVDVAGGLISLAALALFLRVWRPAEPWRFAHETAVPPAVVTTYSRAQVVSAWVPWLLLSLFVFLWGVRPVKDALDRATTQSVPVPGLHLQVYRVPSVVPEPRPEEALFKFNPMSATGTGIFLAALLSAFWLRVSPGRFCRLFAATCYRMRWPLFTIACMLALAYVTRYSGMDATLGLAFTRTGPFYPFGAALLGWLGVALTGSDTSSNALFGSLQKITAEGLVRDGTLAHLTPNQAVLLLATANSTGGVMGKMIDAQSIVVSAAATDQPGQEGAILRFVFWHSLLLAVLMGLLVLLQAYLLTGMIPAGG
jgi:lactate permease